MHSCTDVIDSTGRKWAGSTLSSKILASPSCNLQFRAVQYAFWALTIDRGSCRACKSHSSIYYWYPLELCIKIHHHTSKVLHSSFVGTSQAKVGSSLHLIYQKWHASKAIHEQLKHKLHNALRLWQEGGKSRELCSKRGCRDFIWEVDSFNCTIPHTSRFCCHFFSLR